MGFPRTFVSFSSTDILTVLLLAFHIKVKENLRFLKD
jgi:hypothetical protein